MAQKVSFWSPCVACSRVGGNGHPSGDVRSLMVPKNHKNNKMMVQGCFLGSHRRLSVQRASRGKAEAAAWSRGVTQRLVVTCSRRRVTYSNTFRQREGALISAGVGQGASAVVAEESTSSQKPVSFHGVHHVGLLCDNLERSLEFYTGVLGLEINPDRPDDKLPYRGAWLWIGAEMIHLMELPNPDPLDGRPEHGGRDRHFCVGVENIESLESNLKLAGIEYTKSMSGRAAIFFRDPDMNCLECMETEKWR